VQPQFNRQVSTNAAASRAANPRWVDHIGRVAIFGYGLSGAAALRWALDQPDSRVSSVAVVDSNPAAGALLDGALVGHHASDRLESFIGPRAAEVTGRFDIGIVSPGIPPHSPLGVAARTLCTEVISEVELAYRESSNPWVAITGTNGKTTTTALATHLLNAGGVPAASVGNIGMPTIDAVREMPPETVMVAEVSSFQLDATDRFHPEVAAVVNITPDHTDWHGSFENYALAKAAVFKNLSSGDLALWCSDDASSREYLAGAVPVDASTSVISVDGSTDAGFLPAVMTVQDGALVAVDDGVPTHLCRTSDLAIAGVHNQVNALFAAAIARYFGVTGDPLRRGLTSFQPVPHRLQLVGEVAGVRYYNDSKATNPDAAVTAVRAFPNDPVHLLVGGRNKGSDFSGLARATGPLVVSVTCFGEASAELSAAYTAVGIDCDRVDTMAAAVESAASRAAAGSIVLLSPACASFDEFSNFGHRGDAFRSIVSALSEGA